MSRRKTTTFEHAEVGTFVWVPKRDLMIDGTKLTIVDGPGFCGVVAKVETGKFTNSAGQPLDGWWTVTFEDGRSLSGKKTRLRVEPDVPSLAKFFRRQGWDWAKALQFPNFDRWRPANGDMSDRAFKLAVLDDLLGTRYFYRGDPDWEERKALWDRCRRNASQGWDAQRAGKERP